MNINERKEDILKIIENLDISPTLYKNANDKYQALASYLEEKGISANIYPQGSFALGTVVRPIHKLENASYDLDFIYQIKGEKKTVSPQYLRDTVENALHDSELYDDKLIVNDECFTIEYADIDDVSFSIDIVPAADEDFEKKIQLKTQALRADLIDSSIAIPKVSDTTYTWLTNNPQGYRKWFEEINKPFAEHSRYAFRASLFEKNKHFFKFIEAIPRELERSSLQRVVQILKYHRNIYYSRLHNGDKLKPISAIICTLVAQIAKTQPSNISTFDLLSIVLTELKIYAEQITTETAIFQKNYPSKNILIKNNSEWILKNPANPEDNLTDSWKENDDIASTFFKWISYVYDDLIASLYLDDASFRNKISVAFGVKQVKKIWNNKYETIVTTPFNQTNQAKPWKNI